jgi:hypothetical protein
MGQFLIMPTPRPASFGDTSDGSNNRACPSPVARRSTPPSSSPPGSSAAKLTLLLTIFADNQFETGYDGLDIEKRIKIPGKEIYPDTTFD